MPNQLYSKNPAVVTQRRNILFARNNNQGTSKNRFEKGKWVECAECDESRRSKAVYLTRRCNTMLQSEITGDGMDAVASEISLVE